MTGLSVILAVGVMLGGCVGAEALEGDETLDLAADSEQEASPSFESVQIDGVLYSRAQFAQRFGHRDMHWAVTQESLDQGIPMAFSTEEKRNAVLGLHEANDSMRGEPADMAGTTTFATTFANLYEHTYGAGRILPISGNAYNLVEQSFNDKTSSVRTYGRAIIMYQHSYMAGCSFGIDWGLYVKNLTQWGFCGGGNWNDKVSSVRVL